jgi:hypothetical protein
MLGSETLSAEGRLPRYFGERGSGAAAFPRGWWRPVTKPVSRDGSAQEAHTSSNPSSFGYLSTARVVYCPPWFEHGDLASAVIAHGGPLPASASAHPQHFPVCCRRHSVSPQSQHPTPRSQARQLLTNMLLTTRSGVPLVC